MVRKKEKDAYKPVDVEAYNYILRIGTWARRYCKGAGAQSRNLDKGVIRFYLCKIVRPAIWHPELERRIHQECGRMGAHERKLNKEKEIGRQAKKRDRERQLTLL